MTTEALRDSWQGRALVVTRKIAMGKVVTSIIGEREGTELTDLLLRAVFPDYRGLSFPGLVGPGKIAKNGMVCADMINSRRKKVRMAAIFKNTEQLQNSFRALADYMKLNDADRIEMFDYVNKWVVADFRLDPRMDPRDPDARRLTVN